MPVAEKKKLNTKNYLKYKILSYYVLLNEWKLKMGLEVARLAIGFIIWIFLRSFLLSNTNFNPTAIWLITLPIASFISYQIIPNDK